MAFKPFDDSANPSPAVLAARLALIRVLLKHEHPRDTWDGLSNLVAAISSRIARDQFGNTETTEQRSPKANLAPLVEALKKRRLQDAPHSYIPDSVFRSGPAPCAETFNKPVR
jgi:hypothetical protein